MNNKVILLFTISMLALFSGCNNFGTSPRSHSLIATEGFKEYSVLEKKLEWLDIVMYRVKKEGIPGDLTRTLKEIAVKAESSPFASYVYFIISDLYWNKKEKEIANFYMHKVPEEHYWLLHNEQSIGYLIGLRSISLDNNLDLKEEKCNFLLENHKELVDEDTILYELVDVYKEQYEIEKAVGAMKKILALSARGGILDKRIDLAKMREEVRFFHSRKDWLNKDLKTLMYNIKSAIVTKNRKRLESYMSKTDFEILIPQRHNRRTISYKTLAIHTKWHSNITFEPNLEDFSNENEAYWKSQNWSLPNMRQWYFYFKRIDYPYDETIDGAWEWKAIYFGSIH